MRPRISIVVAADERGAIGLDGQLPWRLPNDLRHFKAVTMGKPIVMGRRTWESIGRALAGRLNVVVSRQRGLEAPGCAVAGSLDEALQIAGDAPEVCVIGGAEIYRLALPLAREIRLTRVHALVDADTFFPALDAAQWEEVSREDFPADAGHRHPYSFLTLRRR